MRKFWKKTKGYLAILVLILSWLALYWITGSRTPWNQFHLDERGDISVYLGDIPTQNYDRMGFTRALVRHCAPEAGWIVGTERGELFLFDNGGTQKWKRNLGIGKLVSICLNKEGSVVVVGEQSPEGNFYAVDTHTGDILWKKQIVDYVGANPEQRSFPSVVHVACDAEGNFFVNAYRFIMNQQGHRAYAGRMVAFDAQGKELWKYPQHENMDSWINWCDVSDASGRAVLSTSAYDFREEMKYKDTMYVLNKQTGALIASSLVPAVPPFDNTVMRGSPNYSQDGEFLAACASDGRGFLFDKDGKILWERFISKPTKVDGAWLNASGRDGFVTKQGVLFTTIATFNRENWQLPTPVEHPSNNSFFLFNLDGTFRYQYRAQGTMEELAFAQDDVACAIGRNVRTHNYKAHGALVVDMATGKEKHFFATEGPLQAVSISEDAQLVAGVEAPALTPGGKILGAYRLHIWKN